MQTWPGFPEQHLAALGAHLQADGRRVRLLVVGGAAMRMRGVVPRATHDVDVLAAVDESGEPSPPDLETVRPLIHRVARDFGIPGDWLNTEVAMQWRLGLPPDPLADCEWRTFGSLDIGLAGRGLLIALKLFATCDHSATSVHCQDLLALSPEDSELAQAREWVLSQDASSAWQVIVDEVICHVQANR
jgi:hypothetical protein